MSVTTRSPMITSPPVGSSRPATMRRSVDFPHPDGPTSTMNSPSAISSETRSTATTSRPNTLLTSSRTICATLSPLDPPACVGYQCFVRQRFAQGLLRSPAGPQPVEAEQRRTGDRRSRERLDLPVGGDRQQPLAHPRQEAVIASADDAAAEDDLHVAARQAQPAHGGRPHP